MGLLKIENLVSSFNVFYDTVDGTYRNLKQGLIKILAFDSKLYLLVNTKDTLCDIDPVLLKLAVLQKQYFAFENDWVSHELS